MYVMIVFVILLCLFISMIVISKHMRHIGSMVWPKFERHFKAFFPYV